MTYPNATWRRFAGACAFSLMLLSAAAGAAAPPGGVLSAGDLKREEGRRHFQQGVALYEEGNFAGALAEFQAAYNTAPAPTISPNSASASPR